jgi:hypothetical protein
MRSQKVEQRRIGQGPIDDATSAYRLDAGANDLMQILCEGIERNGQ